MEGSAPAAKKGGISKKLLAIIAVAVLLIAAVGAAVLLLGDNDDNNNATADNWLDKGFNLEVFYNAGNTQRQTACELLKTGLESLNKDGKIKVTVTPVEWATYLELRKTGKMPMMFIGWAPDYADPDDYEQPFYMSSGTYAMMCGFSNATLDGMIASAAAELNTTQRAAMYEQISMDMYNECYYVWTSQATNYHVMRDWVSGFVYNPMYSGEIWYPMNKSASSPVPDTYRYATSSGNAESFDPAVDYETMGGWLLQNVYETLIFYNGSSTTDLVPVVATEVPTVDNGGISADGLTYNFTIRDGITFSNGNTLTASDVKYSFDRGLMYNDPHGPFWMYGQVLIPNYYDYGMATFNDTTGAMEPEITQAMCDAAIWLKSPTQIQFNLTQAYPAFMSALAFNAGSIVDQQYVEANGGLNKAGFDYMKTHMMGSGPFMLNSYAVDAYWNLDRNPTYWQGPAPLAHAIITQVPDDTSRIEQLKKGDFDGAYVPRQMKASVDGEAGIQISQGNASFDIDFLGLNQKLNLTGNNPELTNVPADFFADKNVRLACAHAFNYDVYINQTWQGTAIQPNGAIPKGMFGYSADIPIYAYNLDLAAQYLKAAKTPTDQTSSQSPMVDLSAVVSRLRD
jgi:ABC-type transport system substrate-binding protein